MEKQNDFSKIVTEMITKGGYVASTQPPFMVKDAVCTETVLMKLAMVQTVIESMACALASADENGGHLDYEGATPPSSWAQTGAINSLLEVVALMEYELTGAAK